MDTGAAHGRHDCCHVLLVGRLLIGREGLPEEAIPPSETGDGAAPVATRLKHHGSVISHSIEDIGRDLVEPIGRPPRLLHGRAREARCTQLFG